METIGDAYMAVASSPSLSESNHALRMLAFARTLLQAAMEVSAELGRPLQLRIGIHTGSAFGGVVGSRSPHYCFYGDTTNVASRMESSGVAMRIQVSPSTYELVKDVPGLRFEQRDKMMIKGKGEMRPYLFVDPDLTMPGRGALHTANLAVDALRESGGPLFVNEEHRLPKTLAESMRSKAHRRVR